MKLNPIPALIALIYTVINILSYKHAISLNGGGSMGYVLIFPIFWIATALLIIALSIRNRKLWFRKEFLFSTSISLLLCTPFPLLLVGNFTGPDSYVESSGSNQINGNSLTFEQWSYYNGKTSALKYWKNGQKDSTWISFNKEGDTVLSETYKEDQLISKKDYK